jgi:stage III sporulation protein AG
MEVVGQNHPAAKFEPEKKKDILSRLKGGGDGGGGKGKIQLSKLQKFVIVLGVAAVLLLCLSALFGKSGSNKSTGSTGQTVTVDLSNYEASIEKRLTELIGGIAGAGKTQVMVTLDCGSEPVYATQGKSTANTSGGTDAALGSQATSDEKSYVIIGSGSGQQGLVLKTLEPKVRGVAILCEGADDLYVKQAVVEAVTRVLGVGANKVSVNRVSMVVK